MCDGLGLRIKDETLVWSNWISTLTANSLTLVRCAVTDNDELVQEFISLVQLVVFLEFSEVLEYGRFLPV